MPYAVVGGITVPVTAEGARKIPQRIGAQSRAWSGVMHESTRAWKDRYSFRTMWMPRADADALEAVLQSAPPIACSGDFFGGAVNCFVSSIAGITQAQRFAGDASTAHHVVYEFELEEA